MDEFEIEREFDERQMYSQKMSEYDDEYSEQKYGVLNDNFRIINSNVSPKSIQSSKLSIPSNFDINEIEDFIENLNEESQNNNQSKAIMDILYSSKCSKFNKTYSNNSCLNSNVNRKQSNQNTQKQSHVKNRSILDFLKPHNNSAFYCNKKKRLEKLKIKENEGNMHAINKD